MLRPILIIFAVMALLPLIGTSSAHADPSKYPQFAQQSLPEDIKPAFITVEELVDAVKAGAKPWIVDVRTDEEFKEAHILGALSAPLASFKDFLKEIPRDRLVALY
jgi:hypothetical protein